MVSCSGGGGGQENEAAAPAEAEATALEPGQWEVTSEVQSSREGAQGARMVTAETRAMPNVPKTSTASLCIAPEQASEPPTLLFAVSRKDCTYDNFYMSGGRIVASLSCPQADGQVSMSVDGTFTGSSIEAETGTTIGIYGTGTLMVQSKLAARRIGACEAEDGAGS